MKQRCTPWRRPEPAAIVASARPSVSAPGPAGPVLMAAIATAAAAWSSPAASTPVTVRVGNERGANVQLRIEVPAGIEPVLAWSGTAGPGPYPLALIWSDASLQLAAPLP